MTLNSLYSELRKLGDEDLSRLELVEPGEFHAAVSTIGGNERLHAVRTLIGKIRQRIKEKPETPRALKLRLAVLANSIETLDLRASSIFESILNDLDEKSVAYELIAPGGDDPPYTAFLRRYPGASWRFVDWDKVESISGSEVKRGFFKEAEELSSHYQECCRRLHLANQPVYVTTSVFEASLRLTLDDLREHSLSLFLYCSDMLFIGENADWIFEVFHEGEYGYGRLAVIQPN